MPANIQVIMQEDVDKVGKSGELVRVRPGFARNYLLPRQLAVAATTAAVRRIEHEKAVATSRAEKEKKEAQGEAGRLSALVIKIERKAGGDGRLFGSVTAKDVEVALHALGATIDKRKIHLAEPIKAVGSHEVSVKLGKSVTVALKVEVIAK